MKLYCLFATIIVFLRFSHFESNKLLILQEKLAFVHHCKQFYWNSKKFRGFSFIQRIFIQHSSFWLLKLLLLSGDVETNPGPSKIICGSCSKLAESNSIICDFCTKNFHLACVNLDETNAKVFTDSDRVFICDLCGPSAKHYFRLEKRIENCEKKLTSMDNKLENVISLLSDLKSDMVNNTDSGSNSSFATNFANYYELESKKRNAVLFGLLSSADDLLSVRNLVENSPLAPSEILYCFRDGPSKDANGQNIDQFLKVVFTTSKARNLFLTIVKKLNRPNLRSRPDLTYEQRQQGRRLRAELDLRQTKGENNLKIDYKTGMIVKNSVNKYNTRSSVSNLFPK